MENGIEVRLFDRLGGEAGLRALVDSFYDRMASGQDYAGIRAMHPPQLDSSRDKLFWFLCGWSGGPDHYVSRYGHPRLRARHLPFAIGLSERNQWLRCMHEALASQPIEPALRQQLMQSFFGTADWMRNRPESEPET